MRIIVPIKQVPETSAVRMDPETGTIVRSGAQAIVNPLDLYAIECALQLRERYGGVVEVLTMGPPRAEVAVREAIAMGCDNGVLVTDRRFAGADTWSTSYVLAQAIRAMGVFDLVVAGERATDGDTAQVGPGIASWLDLPIAGYVAAIETVEQSGGDAAGSAQGATIIVERLVEEGYQRLTVQMPALLTVVKEIATPRLPTLSGKKRSRNQEVRVWGYDDMDLEPSYVGLKGSPTRVVQIKSPKVTRGGRMVRVEDGASDAVGKLVSFLQEKNLTEGARE